MLSFFNLNSHKIKIFYIFLPLIILISPILNFMPAGYDAALYHLPHQNWLKNEKIIFGLANVQDRYGLVSFFNYIGVNFWYEKKYLFGLGFLQGIFFLIFFSFLFYLLKLKLKFLDGIVLTLISTIPIWFRYIEPSYALVDMAYGLIFVITIILGILILNLNKNIYSLVNLFGLFCVFTFMLKPSGIFITLYAFFIILISYKNNKIKINLSFKYFLLPFFIGILWIIKTFIYSGCLIYPLVQTCFQVNWSDFNGVTLINDSITHFATRHFKVLEFSYFVNFLNQYWYYLLILLIICLFIFYFATIKTKERTINKNIKYLYIALVSINFYFYFSGSLKGFSWFSQDSIEFTNITIFKEIFTLNLVILTSAIIGHIFINNTLKINFHLNKNYMPLLFVSFCLLIWFINSPLPRLAYGYFASLSACLLLFSLNKNSFNLISKNNKYLNYLIYLFLFLFLFIQPLYKNFGNLEFNPKSDSVKEIKMIKREGFGVMPDKNNLHPLLHVFCWLEDNCYFYEYDIKLKKIKFNYKMFIK